MVHQCKKRGIKGHQCRDEIADKGLKINCSE